MATHLNGKKSRKKRKEGVRKEWKERGIEGEENVTPSQL